MLLLLHIFFYYYNYCGMGVIVIFIMGVRVVFAIIIIIGIFKLLLILNMVCHFLWFFDFIKFKFTLNFCYYLFGSVALFQFHFILQAIK